MTIRLLDSGILHLDMRIESLQVFHLRKTSDIRRMNLVGADLLPGAFFLDSCQRMLWVASNDFAWNRVDLEPYLEIFSGEKAFQFLLRIATGLESQIIGETDIFGQLKQAWKESLANSKMTQACREEVSPWIQRLFEDTKEIRSRYLEHLGGSSYGTLARKLIRDGSRTSDRQTVLVIGAGQLGASVAPFLGDSQILLWNRSEEKTFELKTELATRFEIRAEIVADLKAALAQADHIIVCIPVGGTAGMSDLELYQTWASGGKRGVYLHLGGTREQFLDEMTAHNNSERGFVALDDVFELQRSQGDVRSLQIGRARSACQERAILRALGSSISIPHGWEDLAAFA